MVDQVFGGTLGIYLSLAKGFAILLELLLLTGAVSVLLRRLELCALTRAAYAILLTQAGLSAILQVLMVLGLAPAVPWVLGALIAAAAVIVGGAWYQLAAGSTRQGLTALRGFIARNRLDAAVVAGGGLILTVQAVALPPTTTDVMQYGLARVYLAYQENALDLVHYNDFRQYIMPWGTDILGLFPYVHGTFLGTGVFSLLQYVALLLGAAALARRITGSDRAARLMAYLVGSFVCLTLLATIPKNDLPCAAIAVVSCLALHRLLAHRSLADLSVLAMLLAWGVNAKAYFPAFILPFGLAAIALYLRESGWRLPTFQRPVLQRPLVVVLALGVVLIVTVQVHQWRQNLRHFGNIQGPASVQADNLNRDGVKGAAYNVFRYSLHVLNWPEPLGGRALDRLHDRLLGEARSVGVSPLFNATTRFGSRWLPHEDYAWYGPLTFLVVLAQALVLLRGDMLARAYSLIAFAFAGAICFKIGYMVSNGRFFAISFVLFALALARFLPQIEAHRIWRRLFVGVCIGSLAWACILNNAKPLINITFFAKKVDRVAGTQIGTWVENNFSLLWLSFPLRGYRGLITELTYLPFEAPVMHLAITSPEAPESGARVLILLEADDAMLYLLHARPDVQWDPQTTLTKGPYLPQRDMRSPAADVAWLREHYDYILDSRRVEAEPSAYAPYFAIRAQEVGSSSNAIDCRATLYDLRQPGPTPPDSQPPPMQPKPPPLHTPIP